MKKIILFVICFLVIASTVLVAQEVPQSFTYQAIARDADGQPLANQTVSLNIDVLEGSPNGAVVYSEKHNKKNTNKFGLFTLQIGTGNTGDDFREIDWQNGTFYVQTEMDSGNGFDLVGTFPILSVPYAILAQRAIEDRVDDADPDPDNELQELSFDPNTQELSISNGNSISIPTGNTDADADPQNELQELSFDAATGELSLTNGNSVTIPSTGGGTGTDDQNLELNGTDLTIEDGNTIDLTPLQDGVEDADSDPMNELQELSFDPATQELSLSNGNSITIPTGNTDADADPQNELQELSFDAATGELSLTNGNSVTIPSTGSGTGTDDQNLELNGTDLTIEDGNTIDLSPLQDGVEDADSDPQNELQELSFDPATQELSLSNGNSVTIPTGGTDADADPQNEIQELSLNGTTISLSNGGGSIDLPTGTTNSDDQNLSLNGTELSIEDGNAVDLSSLQDGVNDADSDPQNEIQEIALTGNTITLSNGGGTIDLPTGTTDTDDQTLNLNGTILGIQDGNTVDLSALQDGVNDADADPQNEIQQLGLTGNTLTLSDGGSVTLPTGTQNTDDQNLSLSGTNLTIEDGNTVDLSALQDGVNDADSNPQNEIQQLSLIGNTLTLTDGGSVILPTGTPSTDDQRLTLNGTNLSIEDGNTVDLSALQDGFNDADSNPNNEIQQLNLNGNTLSLSNGGGSVTLTSSSLWEQGNGFIFHDRGDAFIQTLGGARLVGLGNDGSNSGIIQLYENNSTYLELFPSSANITGTAGQFYIYGDNGQVNCDLSYTENNHGYLGLRDQNGQDKVSLFSSADAGRILLFGQNGALNAGNLVFAGFPNNGAFGVYGPNPQQTGNTFFPEAQLFVDDFGRGVIAGDLKNFYMEHPNNKDQMIWYASLEGPEAAAYERGTATLINGEAFIPFSEHFEIVINPETMTVNLTPMSANTLGLAVVEKTAKGIRVKELMNGTGNFDFDWEVKAVRKGYEDYKVIRAVTDMPGIPAADIPKKDRKTPKFEDQ